MKAKWHVVHVSSRTEKKVAERLEKKGIIAYLPIQKRLRKWSDRKKWVEEVVVSGYVFVNITDHEQLSVLQVLGVSRFLKLDNQPVCIPDWEMQRFQYFIEKTKNRNIEFTSGTISVGMPVTILTGQFEGYSGKVIKQNGKRKLCVELSNFGHFFVTLSPDDVLSMQ
jgi:transcription antitermination factor NusG